MAITPKGLEISKYVVGSGESKKVYYFKDAAAREAISAGMDRKVVTELPTASADTMGTIYMMPATRSGQTQNIYKEYITVKSTDATPVYSWEEIGDTEVDLSDYSKNSHTHKVTAAGTNADSDVEFESHTSDNALGEATTFENAASDVTFADNTNNKASVMTLSADGSVTAGADAELAGGKVASFTQGTDSFTENGDDTFTQGSQASWEAKVDEDNEELSFEFSANTLPTFTQGAKAQFTQGTDSFSANELQSIKEGTGKATQVTLPTFGSADVVKIGATGSAAAQAITVGTNDKVAALTALGKATAKAQTFTGSEVSTGEAVAKA